MWCAVSRSSDRQQHQHHQPPSNTVSSTTQSPYTPQNLSEPLPFIVRHIQSCNDIDLHIPSTSALTNFQNHVTPRTTLLHAVVQQQQLEPLQLQRQATIVASDSKCAPIESRAARPLQSQDHLRPTPESKSQCRVQSRQFCLSLRRNGDLRPTASHRNPGPRETVGSLCNDSDV